MNHVTIDLEVLCSFVKDQVRRDVKSIPVVVVKDWRARTLNMHVLKQEGEPLKLTSYCCQCPILRLGGGTCNETSESPRKKAISRHRPSRIGTTGPVSIVEPQKVVIGTTMKE